MVRDMAEKVTYGITAMAIYSALFIMHIPITTYTFLAGILSAIIDIEHWEYPSSAKSPYTHSLLFSLFWCVLVFVLSQGNVYLTGAILSAFLSHIILDVHTKSGIFLYPSKFNLQTIFFPLPHGERRAWSGWKKIKGGLHGNEMCLNALPILISLMVLILAIWRM